MTEKEKQKILKNEIENERDAIEEKRDELERKREQWEKLKEKENEKQSSIFDSKPRTIFAKASNDRISKPRTDKQLFRNKMDLFLKEPLQVPENPATPDKKKAR